MPIKQFPVTDLDFGDIKSVVREFVYEEFDHRLILRDNSFVKLVSKFIKYMSGLIKHSLEFPINSSVSILYKRLSSPSGLAEWFADDNA